MKRLVILSVLLLLSTASFASTIDVYALGEGGVVRKGEITYRFILQRIDKDINLTHQQRRNFNAIDDLAAQYSRQMQKMYQQKMAVLKLGIQRLPAVVINQHYVVYGTTDVALAARLVRSYRSAHDE